MLSCHDPPRGDDVHLLRVVMILRDGSITLLLPGDLLQVLLLPGDLLRLLLLPSDLLQVLLLPGDLLRLLLLPSDLLRLLPCVLLMR